MPFIDWKRSSVLLASRLPEFVREDAPMFAAFLAAYYEWLDAQGNPSWGIENFLIEMDIDQTEQRFVDSFHDTFMARIPRNVLANRRLLLKHVQQFYRAKGTEQGFRFLFRTLYDAEIEFYYPSRDMWRLDNSTWTILRSLKVLAMPGGDPDDYEGVQIYGSTSGARTGVDRVSSYINSSGQLIYELYYSRSIGTFVEGDMIYNLIGTSFVDFDDPHVPVSNTPIGLVMPGGVTQYGGQYTSFDGHIDREKKLQDDYYYQDFAYVIRSPVSFSTYEQVVSDLLHPAGTKMFGEFWGFENYLLPSFQVASIAHIADLTAYALPSLTMPAADLTTGALLLPPISDISIDALPTVTYGSAAKFYYSPTDTIAISLSSYLSGFSGYTLSSLASWTANTFVNGTGVLGVGATTFTSYLTPLEALLIIDRTGANPPEAAVISAVDSDYTARLVAPYAGACANGQFSVPR